jgi:hypothetical protein
MDDREGRAQLVIHLHRRSCDFRLASERWDEMGSWLVPPIVIPVLIAIMVVVYALYRAYS